MKSILYSLKNSNIPFYLCGDFNIHFENQTDTIVKSFYKMLERNNVTAEICEPTREDAILDNIITNDSENISEKGVIHSYLSDHNACFIVKNCKKLKKIAYLDKKDAMIAWILKI